jgi:hypothetical protein
MPRCGNVHRSQGEELVAVDWTWRPTWTPAADKRSLDVNAPCTNAPDTLMRRTNVLWSRVCCTDVLLPVWYAQIARALMRLGSQ